VSKYWRISGAESLKGFENVAMGNAHRKRQYLHAALTVKDLVSAATRATGNVFSRLQPKRLVF